MTFLKKSTAFADKLMDLCPIVCAAPEAKRSTTRTTVQGVQLARLLLAKRISRIKSFSSLQAVSIVLHRQSNETFLLSSRSPHGAGSFVVCAPIPKQ